MTISYRCDMCDAALTANSSERFIVKIEAYAAVSTEISEEELAKDHRAEIRKTIEQLQTADLDAVEDGVYRSFHFDLCPACHKRYLKQPLPGL